MLSFIVRLVSEFEQEHGYSPNLLYLNEKHLSRLRQGFDPSYDVFDIMAMLGMEMVVASDIAHPQVAWRLPAARKQAV